MFVKRFVVFTIISILAGCQSTREVESNPPREVKNVILFIGDGMGPSFVKAYRMLKDNPKTEKVENILLDNFFVGTVRTDPLNDKNLLDEHSQDKYHSFTITDSAASATAYATGVKTLNGYLSLDENKETLPTILEASKRLGMSTGLVATSQLSHATPAAFASHQESRKNHVDIVNQYIDSRYQGMPYIDVLLGGGKEYFVREDRNVAEEFRTLGYQLVTNKDELNSVNNGRMLGLFADSGLKMMLDRDSSTPSLADMTEAAINQLSSNEKGFFLMVEGSQIDWAGHANDIVGAMSEMSDFEVAVSRAIDFAKKSGDTQVIVTADHSTGGLSIGSEVEGKSYYQWNSEVIRSFTRTPEDIARKAALSGDLLSELKKYSKLNLSDREIKLLNQVDVEDTWAARQAIMQIVDEQSYTGWTTKGHTATDVFLYAYGPASSQLVGNWDNTELAEFMFNLVNQQ